MPLSTRSSGLNVRLKNAAKFFDRDPVYDAYTGLFLFKAQTASYQDESSDGATLRRRTMSYAPGLVMPARRVVKMYSANYLVGNGSDDGFFSEPVRVAAILKQVTDLFSIFTPAQAALGSAGVQAYGQKNYFKDLVDKLTSTDIDTFWNIYFAPVEPIVPGCIVQDEQGLLFRVNQTYLPMEGLRVAQSYELERGNRKLAVFDSGAYDPVTETNTGGQITTYVIELEPQDFYRARSEADKDTKPGDKVLLVPASALTPTVNMKVTLDGVVMRITQVQPELDSWAVKVRL